MLEVFCDASALICSRLVLGNLEVKLAPLDPILRRVIAGLVFGSGL